MDFLIKLIVSDGAGTHLPDNGKLKRRSRTRFLVAWYDPLGLRQ